MTGITVYFLMTKMMIWTIQEILISTCNSRFFSSHSSMIARNNGANDPINIVLWNGLWLKMIPLFVWKNESRVEDILRSCMWHWMDVLFQLSLKSKLMISLRYFLTFIWMMYWYILVQDHVKSSSDAQSFPWIPRSRATASHLLHCHRTFRPMCRILWAIWPKRCVFYSKNSAE